MTRHPAMMVVALLLATGASATAVAASTSPAASVGVKDGEPWIVYSSIAPCGLGEPAPSGQGLCLVRADGMEAHAILTQLTEPKKPDWSRDGQRLAFAAIGPAGAQRIWTSRADGSDAEPIETDITCDVEEAYPAWSPDGTRIAFMCLHGRGEIADLAVVDLATGATRTVVAATGETNAWAPRWSPDGKALVINLEHVTDGQFSGSQVAIVPVDGGEPTAITPSDLLYAGYPDWSPDGTTIVFATYGIGEFDDPSPGASNLYTVKPDGTDLQAVTGYAPGAGRAGWATWTPDGSSILFTLVDGSPARRQIAFVSPDGSDLRIMGVPNGYMARLQPQPRP